MNISFNNILLKNNQILIQSIILLWSTKSYDILFTIALDHVIVRLKGPENAKSIIQKFYPEVNKYPQGVIDYLTIEDYKQFLFQLKLACGLNITYNMIQGGSFQLIIDNKKYSIRVSIHPTNHGESLSLRMIHPVASIKQEKFSIKRGINLIVGPTCSGKTTLMYSMIENYIQEGKIIISLEDPIEREIPNCSQTNVNKGGYQDAIKSALRQNPDLITIGEIRDEYCAKSIIHAALTGHDVLATIHGTSDKSYRKNKELIILRLVEFGISKEQIKQLLTQVIFCHNWQYVSNF